MTKKRIVVKIGSSSLTNERGAIDEAKLTDHVRALAHLKKANHEVVLVSSGAVASGFARLGYASRPETLKGKQAAAAIGQSLLIQSYIEKFSEFGIIPAQILLTRGDFADKERYGNAFRTISELLARNILPIINENDTVVIDELTFGDNDMLSALVSGFIHADELIILTDVNGIYDKNPKLHANAQKISNLNVITDQMILSTESSGSNVGTGGMKSKLVAAKRALSLGTSVFIGVGTGDNKLIDILKGQGDGTYITGDSVRAINTNRQWIALHSESAGKLYIDSGAETAIIESGCSLLPVGITKVEGQFQKGDVVEVYGKNSRLGKGEVSYSAEEVRNEIIRHKQESKSGNYIPAVEVIHRNRWIEI
ncbi:MAG TPA: glutamate 5-kinase [Pseudogracilibacillus sp.]|nr:glutamate 5-kinase [Pseudogracilibacillus sp.]